VVVVVVVVVAAAVQVGQVGQTGQAVLQLRQSATALGGILRNQYAWEFQAGWERLSARLAALPLARGAFRLERDSAELQEPPSDQ
jgi:hypothetical protein